LLVIGLCPLAYGLEGDEIWTRTHNGSANGEDYGFGITTDASGNVYVTGSEEVSGQSRNIWVRKYNSAGTELWTRTYNGEANSYDYGSGITTDASGNVYVIGSEYVTGQNSNIWVRKYNSAGTELWTRTYNGTANSNDYGQGITTDAEGNVYVTGAEYVTG
jgi:hypothetical protein